MNFAEIQDSIEPATSTLCRNPDRILTLSRVAAFLDQIDWLLSRLIKERARAMEAEFRQKHGDTSLNEYCPLAARLGTKCVAEEHHWTPGDWEQEAEKELRKET